MFRGFCCLVLFSGLAIYTIGVSGSMIPETKLEGVSVIFPALAYYDTLWCRKCHRQGNSVYHIQFTKLFKNSGRKHLLPFFCLCQHTSKLPLCCLALGGCVSARRVMVSRSETCSGLVSDTRI